MNPFIAFSLYVAARVFVQYLKAHTDDAAVISSLQFLLSAMQALKGKNPLTGSFLAQLDVDLESSGLKIPITMVGQYTMPWAPSGKSMEATVDTDQTGGTSIFDFREDQLRQQAAVASSKNCGLFKATSSNSMDFSRVPSTQGDLYMGGFPDRSKDSPQPVPPEPRLGVVSSIYEETSSFMNIDISFENMNSQRFPSRSNSGHHTPSISPNNASSHTSFSPPLPDDNPTLTSNSSLEGMSPNTSSAGATFANHAAFPSFDANLSNVAKPHGAQEAMDHFAMPAAWNHANGRLSSGNAAEDFDLTGMTSGDIPSWPPIGVVEGNGGLFSNWNGADTSN